jgi:hypothetical protein
VVEIGGVAVLVAGGTNVGNGFGALAGGQAANSQPGIVRLTYEPSGQSFASWVQAVVLIVVGETTDASGIKSGFVFIVCAKSKPGKIIKPASAEMIDKDFILFISNFNFRAIF